MHKGGKYKIGVSARLLCVYLAVLSLSLVLISLAYSPRASAITYDTGDGNLTINIGTPSGGGQTLCDGDRRADFRLSVSDVSITAQRNESTLKFDLTMRWRACGSNQVDAFALYGAPCPLTGYYGASSPYEANDCLKYVGPNISRPGERTDYPDYRKYLGCNPGSNGVGGTSQHLSSRVCTTNKFPQIEIKRTRPGNTVTAAQTLTIEDIEKAIQSVDLGTTRDGSVTYSREVCSYFQQPAGTDRWGRCRTVSIPISWTYVRHEYPPSGSITSAVCARITGTANDRNVAGTDRRLVVTIVVDGTTTYTVNSAQGGGNWEFTNVIRDHSAHTYAITVTGKNAAGGNSGTVSLGTRTIGPCQGPPTGSIESYNCSGITGISDDPDLPSNQVLRVRIVVDGTATYYVNTPAGGGRWTFNPIIQDFADHSYVITILGKDNAGREDGYNAAYPALPIGHCAKVRCGSPTFSITTPEVGQGFTVRLSMPYTSHNGNAPQPANPLPAAGRPTTGKGYQLSLGGLVSGTVGYSSGGSDVTYTSGSISRPSPGVYTLSWQFARNGTSAVIGGGCSGSIAVVVKPAVKVMGGDVSAGNAFPSAGVCNASAYASSSITGWPGNATYNGSSTEFGAYAPGPIFGFATSKRQAAMSPSGLAFANTTQIAGISDWYGGSFGSMPCIADHAGMKPAGITSTAASLSTLASGSYQYTSSAISGTPTIGRGKQVVLYRTGDLYINSNILYQRSGWATKADIPALKIVVSGNIYIAPGVTELNGVFIAQPTAATNTGVINTCSGVANANLYASCRTPLTVNGVFTAKRVDLRRTNGSASQGTTAETFRYLPEVWMADWPEVNNGVPTLRYDSMSNLAPIL